MDTNTKIFVYIFLAFLILVWLSYVLNKIFKKKERDDYWKKRDNLEEKKINAFLMEIELNNPSLYFKEKKALDEVKLLDRFYWSKEMKIAFDWWTIQNAECANLEWERDNPHNWSQFNPPK